MSVSKTNYLFSSPERKLTRKWRSREMGSAKAANIKIVTKYSLALKLATHW